MSRPTPVARRFYRTFYRWTLLVAPPSASAPPLGLRHLSTTARCKPNAAVKIRKLRAPVPISLLAKAVQSAAELPSRAIVPYTAAVRYRDGGSVVYEIALDEAHVQALMARYGPDLNAFARLHGTDVQVTLGEPFHSPTGRTRPMMVSGRYADADALYARLQTGPPVEPRELAELEASTAWLRWPVADARENSSSQMPPWTSYMRQRTSDAADAVVELTIPDMTWHHMRTTRPTNLPFTWLERVIQRSGAVIEVDDSPARPAPPQGMPLVRSVFLKGSLSRVRKAMKLIATFRNKQIPSDEDGIVESIRDQTQHSAKSGTEGIDNEAVQAKLSQSAEAGSEQIQSTRSAGSSTEQDEIRCPYHSQITRLAARRIMRQSGVALHWESDPHDEASGIIKLLGAPEDIPFARTLVQECIQYTVARNEQNAAREAAVRQGQPVPVEHFARLRLAIPPPAVGETTTRCDGTRKDMMYQLMAQAQCHVSTIQKEGMWELLVCGPPARVETAKGLLRQMADRWWTAAAMQSRPLEPVIELLSGVNDNPVVRDEPDKQSTAEDGPRSPMTKHEVDGTLASFLRDAIRPLSHPVVVVTTSAKHQTPTAYTSDDPENQLQHARGVTVSSFSSVCLHPHPFIAFNLKLPSRTWDALQISRRLCVHILAASSEAAAIAHAFTLPYDRAEEPFQRLTAMGVKVDARLSSRGPIISSSGGAIAAVVHAELSRTKCVEVGDHVIVVAKVIAVRMHENCGEEKEGTALGYAQRRYRALGPAVSPLDINEARKMQSKTEQDYDVDFGSKMEFKGSAEMKHATQKWTASQRQDWSNGRLSAEVAEVIGIAEIMPPPKDRTGRSTGGQRRLFSSMSIRRENDRDIKKRLAEGKRIDVSNLVSHPSILSQTVDEFLGQQPTSAHQIPRMRALLGYQRAAREASAELAALLANGTLTPQRSLELENIITLNERRVAKRLALRAAEELQRMLDTGRVDVRRAQWLESAVEKGMVAVVAQVKLAKETWEAGKIPEAEWAVVREALGKEYDILNQEAVRLRGMMEDEEGEMVSGGRNGGERES